MSELDGFLVGRELRIADWRHRKQKREFAKLCDALRARQRRREAVEQGGPSLEAMRDRERGASTKHRRKMLEQDPEGFRGRHRAACRRFYRAHKESELERQREYRARMDREAPRVCRCRVCGSEWCLLPGRGTGRLPRYCGDECRRARRRKDPSAERRCTACRRADHDLRNCPQRGAAA